MRNRCTAALAQAQKMVNKKMWGEAYEAVTAALTNAVDVGLKSQVIDMAKQIETAAIAWMAEADQACKDKSYKRALELYRQVARMSQFKIAKQATAKLQAVQNNPEFKAAVREGLAVQQWARVRQMLTPKSAAGGADTSAEAAEEYDQAKALAAVKALPELEQVKVVGALESLEKGMGDTSAGKEAAGLHQALLGDSQFATKLETARKANTARQDFLMGQQYQKSGLAAQAVEFFGKAAEDSPASEWGVRAKQELGRMGK